jgi:hypothetical protein
MTEAQRKNLEPMKRKLHDDYINLLRQTVRGLRYQGWIRTALLCIAILSLLSLAVAEAFQARMRYTVPPPRIAMIVFLVTLGLIVALAVGNYLVYLWYRRTWGIVYCTITMFQFIGERCTTTLLLKSVAPHSHKPLEACTITGSIAGWMWNEKDKQQAAAATLSWLETHGLTYAWTTTISAEDVFRLCLSGQAEDDLLRSIKKMIPHLV